MTLRQKQSVFARMAARLIQKAEELGFEVTLGETYRSQAEQGRLYREGITKTLHSLHTLKLAIDLNLFKNGRYLTSTASHRRLGEWWEAQGGSWGGRFGDGNHYSLEHNGVK